MILDLISLLLFPCEASCVEYMASAFAIPLSAVSIRWPFCISERIDLNVWSVEIDRPTDLVDNVIKYIFINYNGLGYS